MVLGLGSHALADLNGGLPGWGAIWLRRPLYRAASEWHERGPLAERGGGTRAFRPG
jgi:hypothetical protein